MRTKTYERWRQKRSWGHTYPNIVSYESCPWEAFGMSRAEFFKTFNHFTRQCLTLEQLIVAGNFVEIERVKERLAFAKRYKYSEYRGILYDTLDGVLISPASDLRRPANRAPRLSDVRDLVEASTTGSPSIETTLANLAGELGCAKSTVRKALKYFHDRGVMRVEPGRRGTRITVLRRRAVAADAELPRVPRDADRLGEPRRKRRFLFWYKKS
jgi:hypothetical protein